MGGVKWYIIIIIVDLQRFHNIATWYYLLMSK